MKVESSDLGGDLVRQDPAAQRKRRTEMVLA
jgi:hypothetical protein